MDKSTVIFRKEKETENYAVFREVPAPGTPPLVGRLYLQKWWAMKTTEVKITIEKEN
jgi:hypothetical protein